MKYTASKVINILSLMILGLIFLLAIFLILFSFSNSLLEKKHKEIECFVSKIIQHPVTIAQISPNNNGLDPVLELHNIIVYNKTKTKKIIAAQKFQVSVDLIGSLLSWRIKPGLLTMSGVMLSFDLAASSASLPRSEVSEAQKSPLLHIWDDFKEFYWLFEQNKFYFKDINIKIRLVNGQFIALNKLKLKLYNDSLQHKLKVSGVFLQENLPAKFISNLKLRTLPISSSLVGFINIEGLRLNRPDRTTDSNLVIPYNLIPLTGHLDILLKNSQIRTSIFNHAMPIDNFRSSFFWQRIKNSNNSLQDIVTENLSSAKSQLIWSWRTFLSNIIPYDVVRGGYNNLAVNYKSKQAQKFLVPTDYVVGRRHWDEQLNINLNNLNLTSGELELAGNIKVSSPLAKFDPIIDADLDFFLEDLAKAKLYYPAKLMPADAVSWLNNAFISSKPMFGRVIFKGAASKFPFDNQEGIFFVDATIDNVHLNYEKAWPALENISGKLVFTNRSMEILAHKAKIMQARIDSVRAFIPDLNKPILSINSVINTDSQLGLRFINASPLKISLGEKLKHISVRGSMQLGLKLLIPLDDAYKNQDTQVNGDILLTNNYLYPKNFNFGINNLEGKLSFTQDALFAKHIKGELFKQPITIDIDTTNIKTRDVLTKIILTGRAAAKDVAAGFNVKLDNKIKGAADYKVLFELHNTLTKNSFLRVDSDLRGVSIDLPEPLFKNSTSSKKSSFTYYFSSSRVPKTIVKYSDQVAVSFDERKNFSVDIDRLNLSLWSDYLFGLKNSANNKSRAIFNKLILKVNKLNALGQTLSKSWLQIYKDNKNWRVNIVALPQIKGSILINNQPDTQISGVFEQLHIKSTSEAKKFTTNIDPKNIVPLDFIIENFSYNHKNFHRVSLATKPQSDGMEISKFSINNPDFKMQARGDWVITGPNRHQTNLYGSLYSQNAGNLLNNLDLSNNVIGGIGVAHFELGWQQEPYNFSLKNLTGRFNVALKKGYIVNLDRKTEIKLGVGKALNALSLRHLSLDITDIAKKGLKFDKFDVNASIKNGSTMVKSLRLDGPIAKVLASGLIGLVAKDYDMYVNVIPHITSSVPVAATFAAGPIIGLVSWVVADVVVAPVINKATTYKYHVTGGWNNPVMEKIR